MRHLNWSLACFLMVLCVVGGAGCATDDEAVFELEFGVDDSNLKTQRPEIPRLSLYGIPGDWVPAGDLEKKRRWEGIVIHHSATAYGCAAHENKYHKSLGWDGLGYHFVINNGVLRNGYGKSDGLVEVGYRWEQQEIGSHCRNSPYNNYWNEHTIGICLTGDFEKTRPTERQWRSLVKLVDFLQRRYRIPVSKIKGHRDIKPTKCPGKYFSLAELRRRLGG